VVLEKSRLQGILRGTPSGELVVEKILSDESVQPGERVLTSGGDQIFPKGLDVGLVSKAAPGSDSFLNIRLKPAANLNKLEEVLVVTQVESRAPTLAESGGRLRAADILAERLPSVPPKPVIEPNKTAADPAKTTATAAASTGVNKVAAVNHNPAAVTGSKPEVAKPGPVPNAAADDSAASHNALSVPKDAVVAPDKANAPVKTDNTAKQVIGRPGAAASATTTGKPTSTDIVPTSTGNSKPSLVTKPASGTGEPSAKPVNKSAVPAQTPAAPPEDPQ